MKSSHLIAAIPALSLALAPICEARAEKSPSFATSPPKLLLLVHQSFQPGKATLRRTLDMAMSRVCNRVAVPNSWIDLEPITGDGQSRASFDPFDSFEELDKAGAEWARIFSQPSEIAKLQQDIQALVASEQTVIAVRRDDVGYRANSIDLSKARILRMLEVRLHPGREDDFIEAFKTLGAAYDKINSDTPWVVYQVNAGMPTPSFLVFVPMKALRQNDDLLARQKSLREAEGEPGVARMQQIAREAYASTESNLYAISPEMSHVSKEFAAGDPEFWTLKTTPTHAKPARNKTRGRTPSNN
jgi:hypothetical protein